jgi:hypothetical protein
MVFVSTTYGSLFYYKLKEQENGKAILELSFPCFELNQYSYHDFHGNIFNSNLELMRRT